MRDTALALGEIANSLKDITLWMIKYQARSKRLPAAHCGSGGDEIRAIIMSLAGGLTQLAGGACCRGRLRLAASAAATGAVGTAAAAASVKVGLLSTALKGVGVAAGVAGGGSGHRFIGFKIGSVLGELLKFDEVFTRLILKKKKGLTDAEIDSAAGDGAIKPSMPKYDLAKAEKEKAELEGTPGETLSEIKLPKETDDCLCHAGLEAELKSVSDNCEDRPAATKASGRTGGD